MLQNRNRLNIGELITPKQKVNYNEFVNLSWSQAEDILMQKDGFEAARIKRKLEGQENLKTANHMKFEPS